MPIRPPKEWFYNAVREISKNPEIDNPEAVAAYNWYHSIKPETKEKILQREVSMAGLPKMYAKMGFKQGWKAFKRAHGGKKRGKRSRMHGEMFGGMSRRRKSSKRIHHAYWLDGDMSVPALIQRPVKRLGSITPMKIAAPVIDLLLIMAGMALAAGTKKAVPIKNPHLMNGTELLVGVGGSLLTKNRFVKMPLLGVALQSTISEAKILMPKMIPLAGDDEMVYLPIPDDSVPQIEMKGDDDRVGVEYMQGDDDRVGVEYIQGSEDSEDGE